MATHPSHTINLEHQHDRPDSATQKIDSDDTNDAVTAQIPLKINPTKGSADVSLYGINVNFEVTEYTA